MRALLALVAVVAALAACTVAGTAMAAGADLTYACTPPQPATPGNCSIWHTTNVQLLWDWNTIDFTAAPVPGSDCASPHVFTDDTTGTSVMCAVWNKSDMSGLTNLIATIRVDKTPPSVTGFTADRPPDHDGWWNHPVTLQFTGTDATSGIAGCDVVSYAGPGNGAPATGGCRDVAGNAATGTFPIQYDATPPELSVHWTSAQVGRTVLGWATSADAVGTQVVRSPGIGGAAASEVYSGPDQTFTDKAVSEGTAYTYRLTALDAAANAVTASVRVIAKRSGPPRLRWRRVKGADYYNVQLFRGDRKVLSVWPHGNRFQLRRTWTYRGKKRVLAAGSYRWYVWPGFGPRKQRRYGKLIANRSFKIAPLQAAGLR
jgi:hypothetical protein